MHKKTLFVIALFMVAAALGIGIFFHTDRRGNELQREDFRRIAVEEYDSVFLSAFPIENYTEEDYSYYRGISLLKTSRCIPNAATLRKYFSRISESGNKVSSVYLGVRPDIITADDLIRLVEKYPDTRFEVIVSYPSMEYWAALSEKECAAQMRTYRDLVQTVTLRGREDGWLNDRLFLYFYNSSEWLTGNPANYEDDYSVNASIAHILSMNTDSIHGYNLTENNYEPALDIFEDLVKKYRSAPRGYPDLSQWDIVFFGDSIIAFEDSASIPGALSGLTGAHVYNCARNGAAASSFPESAFPGISELTDAFLSQDLSPLDPDTLTCRGMSDFFQNSKEQHNKCFIFNFGLNDFFNGRPISSEDPGDVSTYAGALRTSIEKLRTTYPDARFVLMAPSFTAECGYGAEPQSAVGGTVADYVAAAVSLAAEENTLLFNSYDSLGIDSDNYSEYLEDGTHPNAATRYRAAQGLAKLLGAKD